MKKFIEKNKNLIISIVFIVYLLALGYHLFLGDSLGKRETFDSYRYNFTLFQEIIRYIENINVIGARLVILNLAGNVFAFVPFGMFVGYFLRKKKFTFIKTTLLGFAFTVLIEGIQLVTKVGICDIDDVVLNTIGVLIGAAVAKLIFKTKRLS
jgi:hypothetical protein